MRLEDVAARIDGALGGADKGQRPAEVRGSIPGDKADVTDAVATRVGEPIVRLAGGVGGDGQDDLIDLQRAGDRGDRVVGRSPPTREDGVAAQVDGPLRGPRIGEGSAEYRLRLAVHETCIGDAVAAHIGLAVISLAEIGRRQGERSLPDREGAICVSDGIIGGSTATWGDRVGARVDRALGGAGIGERPAEDGLGLAIHEAGIGNAVAAGIGQTVVGLGEGIGRDGQRRGRDASDAAGRPGGGKPIAVDQRRAGKVGGDDVAHADARDRHRKAGPDVRRGVGTGGRRTGDEGDGVPADDPGGGVVRKREVGRGRQAIVGLGDGADQRRAQVGRIGVDESVARAQQADRPRGVGEVVLLVIVGQDPDDVARADRIRIGIAAPDPPILTRARDEGPSPTVVDEPLGHDGERPVDVDPGAGIEREGPRGAEVMVELRRLDQHVEGHPGRGEIGAAGIGGVVVDLGHLQRVRDDHVAIGERRERHGRTIDQGHDAIHMVSMDDLLGVQVHRLRRQPDEAIRHGAGEGNRHPFRRHQLGPVVDDDVRVHHPRMEVQGNRRIGGAHQGREVAVDRRVVDDRAAGGGDREVHGSADVPVEFDRPSLGRQRPGESAPAGGIIEVDVAGVKRGIPRVGTAELEAKLEGRGAGDIRADIDPRSVQPEDGIATAAVGEGADEIDVRVRLQVDVRGGERRIEGRRADRGLPEGRQRTRALRAAGHDIDHIRVQQPGTGASERGEGRDEGPRGDFDLGRRRLDEPAVAPRGCADVQATGDADQAARPRGQQQDAAFLTGGQSLRLDQAAMVDGCAGEVPRRGRRQQHVATRRPDRPAIGDKRIHRPLLQDEPDDAPEGKRDLAGGREPDAALGGRNRPLVQDLGRDQDHETSLTIGLRHDIALVDDRGGRGSGQSVTAGHEVGIGHRQRRGDQPADVHLRGRGEEDAVGVEEEDPAVGREGALDDRGVGAHHAVEQDGSSRGLLEVDRMAGADREALPADRGAVRGLAYGHDLTDRGGRGRARRDVRGDGQGSRAGDPGDPEGVQESEEAPTGG